MSDDKENEDLFGIEQNTETQIENFDSNKSSNPIRLIDIINIIKVRLKLIILLTAFSAIVSIVIALVTTPVFRADVVMINQQNDQSEGGLANMARQFGSIAQFAGIDLQGDTEKGTALAILRSRQFTDRFLEEYDLLKYIFHKDWDEESNNWKGGLPPKKSEIYLEMTSILQFTEDRMTGIMTLSFFDRDPDMAAKIANDIVYFLNQDIRQEAIRQSQTKIEYLNLELEKTSMTDARQMLFSLIAQQTQKIMLANAKEDYVFKIIDPAIPPERRIKPKRKMMVITGTAIGAFLSMLIAIYLQNRRPFLDKLKNI